MEDDMKALWFHLMPYQDLPDDFKDKHPSVWVSIDRQLFDSVRGHQLYNEYLDELEFASECGFDAICVNEHHSNAYGLMPSPNIIAGALARSTKDTALCVLGNSVALYNPPTRVAEEMAMIDCISGGRLIAGFPVGTPMDTCFAYGQNPDLLRPRYYEAIDLITKAWESDQPFSFNGRFNQQRYINAWPRPLQSPRPPVWIPGSGSVEAWDMCAHRDFVYCYLSYFGWQASAGVMKGFWQRMKELKMEPNPFRAGFLQFVGVAETRKEAEELYAEPAAYFYQRSFHLDPRFAAPPGYTTEETVRAKLQSQVQLQAGGGRLVGPSRDFSKTNFFDEGHVIIGSPDEVAAKLREVMVELNVGNVLMLLHFGNMSRELTRYNTELFSKRVLPQIKDVFEDQWEHHWWPKPMAREQLRAPVRMAAAAQ
jgi:alkanesulfonate monooxygenase SsuD/methylene tetrahydromethanopterin reductase-like flavin-dependent oxidoreductase (luciferase family)